MLLHTLYPDVEAAEGLSPPNRAEIQLHQEFLSARRGAEAASLYAHASGRYPLTGVGDVNTYALFAETFAQLVATRGRAGFLVPTGIATDDSTKAFFGAMAKGRLVSLHDLRTGPGLFAEIGHQRFKFCLLTLGCSDSADFLFFALSVDDLADPRRHFQLTPDEFAAINPNTRTCPVFRSQRDAELTKKIYRTAPVFIAEGQGPEGADLNPWGIRFSTMFHMSGDSALFLDYAATEGDAPRLPLYEAKMVHQFDHRWATYVDAPTKPNGLDTEDASEQQKANPMFAVRPRYWVQEAHVLARIARVPGRVINAWLAWHVAQSGGERRAAADALQPALASWVASTLFRDAIDASDIVEAGSASLWDAPASLATPQRWSNRQRQQALLATERALTQHFPLFGRALTAVYPTSTRLLAEVTKWALQDEPAKGLSLAEDELTELRHMQMQSANEAEQAGAVSEDVDGQPGFNPDFLHAWMDRRSPRWLMGWRRNARSTDERTTIATVMPRSAQGDSVFLWMTAPAFGPAGNAALLANLSTLVFDYVARQKVGGMNFSFYFMKQLPVLPPDVYSDADLNYIVPRVLELTYTAYDMQPWADDLSTYDARPANQRTVPFAWIPDRRAALRAELDAYYARLYDLTREELEYILDPAEVMGADYPSETFRVLRSNELRAHGLYRTRQMVLDAWDRLSASAGFVPSGIVFSDQALIRNEAEADLAGLVVQLILQHRAGLSLVDLQSVLAYAKTPGIPGTYLSPTRAARLSSLVASTHALALPTALELVPPIVQRLEASDSIRRSRNANKTVFVPSAGVLPSDVRTKPEHAELATLVLELEAKRQALCEGNAPSERQGDREVGTG